MPPASTGVARLTKTAVIEYYELDIRVIAVRPGAINIPMMDRPLALDPKARRRPVMKISSGADGGSPGSRRGREMAVSRVGVLCNRAGYASGWWTLSGLRVDSQAADGLEALK